MSNKIKVLFLAFIALSASVVSANTQAAYESRFDVHHFKPVVDGGPYFTVYDSDTHDAWQGNLGVFFDYANRPLQFKGTGGLVGRQSIIDHITIANVYGSIGFTDWFTAGVNIPVVVYNWYFTDDINADADHGAGMGDLEFVFKFRLIDINKHKVGLALIPRLTAPTGDVERYMGNGNVTGGATVALDFKPHQNFQFGINVGANLRDEVTRNGVTIGNELTFGAAAAYRFAKNWEALVEINGTSVLNDLMTINSTPVEVGGGVRHYFGDSGFALNLGGYGGLTDGVGASRFRVVSGLTWTSPNKEEKVEVVQEAPQSVVIQNDRILLNDSIYFDTAKSTIKPQSYEILNAVVALLQKNPQVKLVEIQGHTDSRGSDSYNLRLSQQRAQAVKDYLIRSGVDSSRLSSVGHGESRPVASNSTPEGMSLNRRTEFHILQQ